MPKRILQGVVVSDKNDKTIVVLVERRLRHPVLKKTVRLSKKYHAHDEKNEAKAGDIVRIEETRPLSKQKRWALVEKVARLRGERFAMQIDRVGAWPGIVWAGSLAPPPPLQHLAAELRRAALRIGVAERGVAAHVVRLPQRTEAPRRGREKVKQDGVDGSPFAAGHLYIRGGNFRRVL